MDEEDLAGKLSNKSTLSNISASRTELSSGYSCCNRGAKCIIPTLCLCDLVTQDD